MTHNRLTDVSGKMDFKKEAEGAFKKNQLDPNDVFIIDSGEQGSTYI